MSVRSSKKGSGGCCGSNINADTMPGGLDDSSSWYMGGGGESRIDMRRASKQTEKKKKITTAYEICWTVWEVLFFYLLNSL